MLITYEMFEWMLRGLDGGPLQFSFVVLCLGSSLSCDRLDNGLVTLQIDIQ